MLLGVDVGGTFTDAVLVDDSSAIHTAKVPSTPSDQSLAVLDAVRSLLAQAGVAAGEVERFAHGMTVATNALLEGRSARTALVATAGFTDVIELGRQNRPHLYDLCAAAPAPLVPASLRFGARERMGPDGPVQALDADDVTDLVARLAREQPEAVAVSLLHSYADATHERELGRALGRQLPDAHLSLSSELVGTFREYERTATTALDAALSPLLGSYLTRLRDDARAIGLREPEIMQSSGGLTEADRAAAHAALTVLSGPAGGVGGALALAGLADEPDVVCLDMGGTSCDVCLIEGGQVAETAQRTVAGRPLALPALDIHTVGAGGGSIGWRDPGGALRVGPESSGADPGPACYGRGGVRPTVTDANLVLGRLVADSPLAGDLRLDRDAAQLALAGLAEELGLDTTACAEGVVRVAEAEMLAALRLVTVQRGIDPRDFALMAFGGAGPLHAAALARQLGVKRVLCPRTSGVLCALGLAAAAPRRDVARTVMLGAGEDELSPQHLARERDALVNAACAALGETPERIRVSHELRYRGQSFELPVHEELARPPADGIGPRELRDAFAHAHEQRYGYADEDAEIELVNIRVSAWGAAPRLRPSATDATPAPALAKQPAVFDGEVVEATVVRGDPPPGFTLEGPALCALAQATVSIPPGWSARVDEYGTICMNDARSD
jgi:N-methylhydantoinase A